VDKIDINVKQYPGMNYPRPPRHVCIEEKSYTPPAIFRQPFFDKHEMVH
jgi:hypothetical protein